MDLVDRLLLLHRLLRRLNRNRLYLDLVNSSSSSSNNSNNSRVRRQRMNLLSQRVSVDLGLPSQVNRSLHSEDSAPLPLPQHQPRQQGQQINPLTQNPPSVDSVFNPPPHPQRPHQNLLPSADLAPNHPHPQQPPPLQPQPQPQIPNPPSDS